MFEQLQKISYLLATENEAEGRDLLIKLLNNLGEEQRYSEILIDLLVAYGLHPHLNLLSDFEENSSISSAISYEVHTKKEFTFHPHQKYVFNKIKSGESVILSAPTSYGKTTIIIKLIQESLWNNILLIFPTLALVDENRRKISKLNRELNLGYKIITNSQQDLSDRNIFILTPERYLAISNQINIDFFFIDEFYKLDSDDDRRSVLNIVWKKLSNLGLQFCLFGPYIDKLSDALPELVKGIFIQTDIETVAHEVFDKSSTRNKDKLLIRLVSDLYNDSTIIYTKSPSQANNVSRLLSVHNIFQEYNPVVASLASWISKNYFPNWAYVDSLKSGYALHYGPLPRSLQRLSLRLFNEKILPILVCTSTIIEGTNTVANNIIIYDNKVATRKFDYFTYRNISGRSGRLGKHLVGKVFLLSPPPADEVYEVDIPIESQSSKISTQELLYIDPIQLSKDSLDKVKKIEENGIFTLDFLKEIPELDPLDIIISGKKIVNQEIDISSLCWTGNPTSSQLKETLLFSLMNLKKYTRNQSLRIISIIRNFQSSQSLAEVIHRHSSHSSDPISDILKFQRNDLEYKLPSLLASLQRIIIEIYPEISSEIDYSYFISQLENSFGSVFSRQFEEIGLPMPLTQKLESMGLFEGAKNFDEAVQSLHDNISRIKSKLNYAEIYIILDVISGV